jgi:hypothetical protein
VNQSEGGCSHPHCHCLKSVNQEFGSRSSLSLGDEMNPAHVSIRHRWPVCEKAGIPIQEDGARVTSGFFIIDNLNMVDVIVIHP